MQIHEVTQLPPRPGLVTNLKSLSPTSVARGFVSGLTGVNFPQPRTPMQPQTVSTERIVVTITQPMQTNPAKYFKTGNTWTNERGQEITKPESVAYLERLVPTHGQKEVVSAADSLQPSAPTTSRRVSRRRTKS